ncbi:hypothetical protein [Cellvibrio mixtus]|uniref:hypothetical protein n=1 Tax=Cellvibrio mixtus TaxID=39650 RepID=UPI0005866836|nr:hypothetical protein [Cellvibrio mixtus]
MKLKNIFAMNVMAAALVACGGGDVNLNPSTTVGDNIVNNPANPTPTTNPCAQYEQDGQKLQGTVSGKNCVYNTTFASSAKQLKVSLFIPELADGGAHIFQGSLFIGEDVDNNVASAGKRIPQEGEGATLTVAAGAKIGFERGEDYLRIARGSKIIAEGTKDKPIIFSGVKDLRDNAATISDRGLWGGIQINGNGKTNKCTDIQRQPTANNVHGCHITSEGLPGTYGGNNNAESSGVLKYVIVKHAGYKVVEGNELNAITLNAVGSKTILDYVQSYAAQDDAFEWFGGAVNAKHLVAVGTSDDAFDFTDGYVGNIQFALSVHPTGVGGNNCIEADNTGTGRADDITPLTKVRVSNLTCVTNNVAKNQGTTPSPDGDSLGLLIREGFFIELYNSVITSNATGAASKALFTFNDTEGPQTIKGANDGWSVAKSNLFAGTGGVAQSKVDPANGTFTTAAWLANTAINSNNTVITAANQLPVNVLKGSATNDKAYLTLAAITDASTAAVPVALFDVSKLADSFQAGAVPATGTSTFFVNPTHLGAASETNDWVAGWTVGL